MDNYAFHLERLKSGDGATMAALSGGEWNAPDILLPHLDRTLSIHKDTGEITPWPGNKNSAALVYQYIADAVGIPGPDAAFISFLQLPNGAHHNEPFRLEALVPLAARFGADPEGFVAAAEALGGVRIQGGEAAYQFAYYPKVALRVILWGADEEFPAKAAILFDNKSHFHLDTAGLYMAGIDLASLLIERAGK